jgi:hypothetical protein
VGCPQCGGALGDLWEDVAELLDYGSLRQAAIDFAIECTTTRLTQICCRCGL